MPHRCSVTLVATVHQPNDALGELTRATLPQLQALYGALVFLCSHTTSAEIPGPPAGQRGHGAP